MKVPDWDRGEAATYKAGARHSPARLVATVSGLSDKTDAWNAWNVYMECKVVGIVEDKRCGCL